MKKILLLLLYLVSCFLNAKEYEFDSMTSYSLKHDVTTSNRFIYYNSKDGTYYLYLVKDSDSWTAVVNDFKQLKKHYFEVTEKKVGNSYFTKYTYKNSTALAVMNQDMFLKYVYEFETLEETENIKKVKVTIFKNSKKKRIMTQYYMELQPNVLNAFNGFRMSCLHPYEGIEKFNINENYLVKYAKCLIPFKGNLYEYNLIDFKEINFIIKTL